MKLSLNWIKDFVAIPDEIDLVRLSYDLTMSTVEVEGAENLKERFEGIIVGLIEEVISHPNADKLSICKVDIGEEELKDIVCGGSNLRPGMKVVIACPGAMVRWHGEGELVEIKKAKLRGVESYGMICAAVEVGLAELFPAEDDHSIMDISAFDAPAGTPLAKALDLDDVILEIDNKSMTNRPDLWGHYGIARELAALYDLPLKKMDPYISAVCDEYDVRIMDVDRCPRYIGVRIEGLEVKPSPFWMQCRLWKIGMRPINALVDITNYVMLATGQPAHVFDANHIRDHIEVRGAREGETLLLLNEKEIVLSSDDLVVADAEGAVALAGVMGGVKDSVLPKTQSVVLEVANFDSRSVRGMALRYDNRTEASSRYEKAIDPERCDQALSLSMRLFAQLYPQMRVTAFRDLYLKKARKTEINVEFTWLARRLGKRIPQDVIAKKLGALGFDVTFEKKGMHIVVPSWRSTGDVSIKADIMEEVARMYGYENFQATAITTSFEGAINQLGVDLVRRIKEYLAFRCNMQEIFTYPWMSDEFVHALMPNTEGILVLSTPPAPNEKYIRSSLLPNICKAIVKNEHKFEAFDIFEEAQIFIDKDYTCEYRGEALPCQRKHLGCAFVGSSDNITGIFRRAKGVIGAMPRYTHMESFTFEKRKKPYWSDDTVWLNILLNGTIIGELALLSKEAALLCGIEELSAVLVELNMDQFVPYKSRTNEFVHVSKFPMSNYDLSFIFDAMVKWDEIYACAIENRNEVLHDVLFVEEYTGKQIPTGKKSVTFRLVIGDMEKTLVRAEIESVAQSVIKRIEKKFGAEIRNG